MAPGVVVIGAGHAGVQLADSLREFGYDRPITLIDAQDRVPYQRPLLSKEFLAQGEPDEEGLPLRGSDFYPAADVTLVRGKKVVSIDRERAHVLLDDATKLTYDHLVFATGARARPLPLDGADLDGVVGLRTMDDALGLQSRLESASRLVVIGAGFIGLEVAAAARKRGIPVTVVEAAPQPMARGLTPIMSAWFADAVGGQGIDLLCEVGVSKLTGSDGTVTGVELVDGVVLPADLVIVGIGVLPNSELAADSGLAVDNGILVDENLATADPAVSAIGDCARFPHPSIDGLVRLESVQNATDQARHLAARLAGKPTTAYSALPWFWSHQGPFRLNIAGLARSGLDLVVRGDAAAAKFSVFGFEGDVLRCVESVNSPGDHIAARSVLTSGRLPNREQIEDPAFDFKAFSKAVPQAREVTRAP